MRNIFFDFIVSKNLNNFFVKVIQESFAQSMRDCFDKTSTKSYRHVFPNSILARTLFPNSLEETISNGRDVFINSWEKQKIGETQFPTNPNGDLGVDHINKYLGTVQIKRFSSLNSTDLDTQISKYINRGIMTLKIFVKNPDFDVIGEHETPFGMKVIVIKESDMQFLNTEEARSLIRRMELTCEKHPKELEMNMKVSNEFSEDHNKITKKFEKELLNYDYEDADDLRDKEKEVASKTLIELHEVWSKKSKEMLEIDLEEDDKKR